MTRASAQAALDRRCAAASLAGAALGKLPLLWLIREALDEYCFAAGFAAARAPEKPLLRVGERELWLEPWSASRVLVERTAGNHIRVHEVSNAALVLYDAVKSEPVIAERLLVSIQAARKAAL